MRTHLFAFGLIILLCPAVQSAPSKDLELASNEEKPLTNTPVMAGFAGLVLVLLFGVFLIRKRAGAAGGLALLLLK